MEELKVLAGKRRAELQFTYKMPRKILSEYVENFCRQGAGRMYRYWYNDKIAAMDLCIEGNGSIIVLKTNL